MKKVAAVKQIVLLVYTGLCRFKAVLYHSFSAWGYLVSAVCETVKFFLSKKTDRTILIHGNCCEAAGE